MFDKMLREILNNVAYGVSIASMCDKKSALYIPSFRNILKYVILTKRYFRNEHKNDKNNYCL